MICVWTCLWDILIFKHAGVRALGGFFHPYLSLVGSHFLEKLGTPTSDSKRLSASPHQAELSSRAPLPNPLLKGRRRPWSREKTRVGKSSRAEGPGWNREKASFCQVNSFSQGARIPGSLTARIPGATRQKWKLPRGDRKLEPAGKGALRAAP